MGSNPIARSKNTSYLKLSFGQELFRLAFDPDKPGEACATCRRLKIAQRPQLAGSIKLAQKSKQGHRPYSFWLVGNCQCMPSGWSETDLTEDLEKFNVPTLILHD